MSIPSLNNNNIVALYSDYYGNKLYAKYENGDFSYSSIKKQDTNKLKMR